MGPVQFGRVPSASAHFNQLAFPDRTLFASFVAITALAGEPDAQIRLYTEPPTEISRSELLELEKTAKALMEPSTKEASLKAVLTGSRENADRLCALLIDTDFIDSLPRRSVALYYATVGYLSPLLQRSNGTSKFSEAWYKKQKELMFDSEGKPDLAVANAQMLRSEQRFAVGKLLDISRKIRPQRDSYRTIGIEEFAEYFNRARPDSSPMRTWFTCILCKWATELPSDNKENSSAASTILDKVDLSDRNNNDVLKARQALIRIADELHTLSEVLGAGYTPELLERIDPNASDEAERNLVLATMRVVPWKLELLAALGELLVEFPDREAKNIGFRSLFNSKQPERRQEAAAEIVAWARQDPSDPLPALKLSPELREIILDAGLTLSVRCEAVAVLPKNDLIDQANLEFLQNTLKEEQLPAPLLDVVKRRLVQKR